jgi:soluble lytic murein transglycosylase-like protein
MHRLGLGSSRWRLSCAILASIAPIMVASPAVCAPDDPPVSVLRGGLPGYRGAPALAPPRRESPVVHAALGTLIDIEALAAGIPAEIATAVVTVESGGNPDLIGEAGEVGLMQVLPSTARMLGFNGMAHELAQPDINIRLSVRYLAAAWRLAGGDLCTTVMKYRAGHGESRFSYRSVDYCLKVRAILAARGYAVTGTVPLPTFGEAAGTGARRTRAIGRIDFEALNAHLRVAAGQIAVRSMRSAH